MQEEDLNEVVHRQEEPYSCDESENESIYGDNRATTLPKRSNVTSNAAHSSAALNSRKSGVALGNQLVIELHKEV